MAAEIKFLAKGDPVPLDLLVRSNLVQQELTRLGINSIALLYMAVKVAPDVMLKLRDLLDREIERHDHERMGTMQRLTITEKTEKIPIAIRSRDVELDCKLIVNQLVSSIPKDVLLRTSYVECLQSIATQTAQEVNVELRSSVTSDTSDRPRDKILSGESRNITNKAEDGDAESIGSTDISKSQLYQP